MGNAPPCRVKRFDREVASLLLKVFEPRDDVFAWRVDDPATAERLTAWERQRCGPRGRTWRVGDWRPAGPRGARRPVTADEIALHVAGARTLGVYPMLPDGTCRSVSADFDDHRGARVLERDPAEDFEALAALLAREGVPCLAHRSRGGRGFWVHLLPPAVTSARAARAVFAGLLREAGVRSVAEGGTFDGLFPKADVEGEGPGNLFCLPLNRRWLANDPAGSGFVGVDPADFEAQVFHLWRARRVPRDRWDALVARFTTPARVRATAPPREAPPPIAWARGRTPWEVALRRAGRLGRPLGGGRHAVLCVNDAAHTAPERDVENARGSCVLFPASPRHPRGYPWCAHAHCAGRSERDWVDAVGRDAWDDACLAVRGMRRAGAWLLHPGGVTTWYRDAGGAIAPSRRDQLCDVPVWIAEDVRKGARTTRVVEAAVGGRTRRVRVRVEDFASLAWLPRLTRAPVVLLPPARARLVEALERLSDPVPLRDASRDEPVDQAAAQARADDLLSLLDVVLRAKDAAPSNDVTPAAASARR